VALAAAFLLADVALIADLMSLEFFRAHATSVLGALVRDHALSTNVSNLRGILPLGAVGACAAFAVAGTAMFARRRRSSLALLAPSALVLAGYVFSANRNAAIQASLDAVTAQRIEYEEDAGDLIADKPLHAAKHLTPLADRELPFDARTIVVFINESCPWHFPSSADPKTRLFDKLMTESGGAAADWLVFTRAFTNSSTTNISMPSMLTGSDSTAGTDDVERFPFLYDMAKVRGYTTGYFTSQDYSWATMRTFLSSTSLDTFISSEITGERTVNLMGIDDMYIARRVADFIRAKGPDGRLFIVVNNNALHLPFQTESAIDFPSYAREPKRRAAYIIEQFYAEIYQSLRQTGRLGGALLIMTSDHGEADPARPRSIIDRLENHYDEVANIPLAIRLPPSVPPALRARMASNLSRTVSNLDLAPTLLSALGLSLPGGAHLPGYDLFGAVPKDRVSISVSNNEWRPWHLSAFGIACEDDRIVYHPTLGLLYFDVKADPAQARPIKSGAKLDAYRLYIAVHPTLSRWLRPAGSE
jgi:hypothetical protein